LLAGFEAAGRAAQKSEEELRRKLAEEVARLERQRAFAFRRTRLIRALATAAEPVGTEQEAVSAQRHAVRSELGWSHESAAYGAILDLLRPVGQAVWQCACGGESVTASDVHAALAEFEGKFEEAHGKSFYALFDQYVPEVPVVDF